MKLTVKQHKFADNYIESGNATQAAIDAGYAKRSAHSIGTENLQKPAIKQYIKAKMTEIQSKKIADAEEVMEYYTRVLRGEETEEVAVSTPVGAEVVEVPPNIRNRINAGKEILKRYPGNDKLRDAQARKAIIDVKLKNAQLKAIEGSGARVIPIVINAVSTSDDEQIEVSDDDSNADE